MQSLSDQDDEDDANIDCYSLDNNQPVMNEADLDLDDCSEGEIVILETVPIDRENAIDYEDDYGT